MSWLDEIGLVLMISVDRCFRRRILIDALLAVSLAILDCTLVGREDGEDE